MKILRSDIAIVGAGLAGLTAGARLAQAGFRVTIVERGSDEDYLCNSRIASGSLQLAQSDPTLAPAALFKAIFRAMDGVLDSDLASSLSGAIGPALTYLRAQGVGMERVGRPGRSELSWSLSPPRPAEPGFDWRGRGPDLALRALLVSLRKCGGRVVFGARAQELIFPDGTASGLRGVLGSEPFELRAPCIVLADGGFQGDRDLVARFISSKPELLVARHAGSSTGDALRMAEAIGAGIIGASCFYGHLLAQDALVDGRLWPYPTLDSLVAASVLVDEGGRRFLDEGMGGVGLANAVAKLKDPLGAIAVFDHSTWETIGRGDFTPANPYVVVCGGKLATADSIEGLAPLIDLDPDGLVTTIRTYNAALAAGRLQSLEPRRTSSHGEGAAQPSARPIRQPPFHALRICAGLTYTMGGLQIDAQARVLDRRGIPISGLYAAGSCVGGAKGGPNAAYLGGLCKAIGLGYLAAESIIGSDRCRGGDG